MLRCVAVVLSFRNLSIQNGSTMGNAKNAAVVGSRLKGEREAPEFIVVRYWRKIINSKDFRQWNSIELDKTLIAKAKMLFTWSHVKSMDYKGWDHV